MAPTAQFSLRGFKVAGAHVHMAHDLACTQNVNTMWHQSPQHYAGLYPEQSHCCVAYLRQLD